MCTFKRSMVMALVVCLGLAPVAFAKARTDGPSKALERAEGVFDRVVFANQMAHLHDQLASQQANRAFAAPLRVNVTPEDLGSIRDGAALEQKMKVGVVKELRVPVDFSDVRGQIAMERVRNFGAIQGHASSFVWSGPVLSPGASALRVHLTEFFMPEGSELYIYTPEGMAFGPYTGLGPNGTGDFWTNTIVGSDAILQVHHAGDSSERPSFVVSGVGHLTREFQLAATLAPQPQAAEPNCSFNANCVVGAGCASSPAVATAEDAVALMVFASGRWLYICSGGLVADSDSSSTIPYFLTANHCISKSGEASSLETFFFYTATCGTCPSEGNPSTVGSSLVATNRTSDYTLLRLNQNAPGGAAYLGWNADPVADSNGDHLYRISHPGGAPQSYSEHDVDTSKGTCQSWPRGPWIYSRDVFGATEGGSSGSPVVNASGQLVGQLSGACGFNVNDNCDSASNATVDGAFAAYYESVAAVLGPGDGGGGPDPENCSDGVDNDGDGLVDCDDGDCISDPSCDSGGGCTDNDGDGYCVEDGDCNDNDSHVYPGHQDTKGRWGRDGVDNDCNGVIDG